MATCDREPQGNDVYFTLCEREAGHAGEHVGRAHSERPYSRMIIVTWEDVDPYAEPLAANLWGAYAIGGGWLTACPECLPETVRLSGTPDEFVTIGAGRVSCGICGVDALVDA